MHNHNANFLRGTDKQRSIQLCELFIWGQCFKWNKLWSLQRPVLFIWIICLCVFHNYFSYFSNQRTVLPTLFILATYFPTFLCHWLICCLFLHYYANDAPFDFKFHCAMLKLSLPEHWQQLSLCKVTGGAQMKADANCWFQCTCPPSPPNAAEHCPDWPSAKGQSLGWPYFPRLYSIEQHVYNVCLTFSQTCVWLEIKTLKDFIPNTIYRAEFYKVIIEKYRISNFVFQNCLVHNWIALKQKVKVIRWCAGANIEKVLRHLERPPSFSAVLTQVFSLKTCWFVF